MNEIIAKYAKKLIGPKPLIPFLQASQGKKKLIDPFLVTEFIQKYLFNITRQ